ncbi:alkene reductase [Corynebacterium diphtheriae]|nr:alkene reductase [Corynebacterium diphtheriae]CAB0760368.1 alkene reductase [Corynebacterium diphtheriae]
MTTLFESATAGVLELNNRITMAPLTRSRAGQNGVPTDMHVEYYKQRANNGLIVTEGTFFEDINRAFLGQTGIATADQQEGWRKVAQAVHEQGSNIVMQIMHGGRLTLPSINGFDQGESSSAIAPGVTLHGDGESREEVPTPVALDAEGIKRVIQKFTEGARRAIDAGMDGVEVHGANGYLLHQFLAPSSNDRTDEYGGSPENRARLAVEVIRSIADEIGADRLGLRISPMHNIQGCIEEDEDDVRATYKALLDGIADLNIAYLSILYQDAESDLVAYLRESFGGFTILNTGFVAVTELEDARYIVENGLADAVAVGREIIANPDLSYRWKNNLALNSIDFDTFYTPGPHGYIDYPVVDDL